MGGRGSSSMSASQLVERQVEGNMYLLTAEQAEELSKIEQELELMNGFNSQLSGNVRDVVKSVTYPRFKDAAILDSYLDEFRDEDGPFHSAAVEASLAELAEEGSLRFEARNVIDAVDSIRDVVDFAGQDRRKIEANIKILEERKRKILQNARRL